MNAQQFIRFFIRNVTETYWDNISVEDLFDAISTLSSQDTSNLLRNLSKKSPDALGNQLIKILSDYFNNKTRDRLETLVNTPGITFRRLFKRYIKWLG